MNNKKQIKIIAIILVAVIALSIGFAAFSATLKIESQANVNPNSDDFSVVFSKLENTLDESDVKATNIVGDSVVALDAKIDNSNSPTITNLNVSFTSPGSSATYEFYVLNDGEYNAYLRDVNFKTINDKFISCIAGSGATPSLVQSACEGIKFELTIGDQTYTEDGAFVVQELAKTTSKKVTVKISYETGSQVADGPFTVNIGDVALTYATTSAGEYPQPEIGNGDSECEVVNVKSFGDSCTYQDLDSTSTITKGDKVTCGTESFYVIEDLGDNINVKMLSEWNLNITDGIISEEIGGIPYSYTYCESTEGYQDSHVRGYLDYESDETLLENLKYLTFESEGETAEAYIGYGLVPFDSTARNHGYWIVGDNRDLNTSIYTACTGDYCEGTYPANVYDDNATIKEFVDDYTLLLNTNITGAEATGRLITYEELVNLGCSGNYCTSAPSWVYQTSYWTASARLSSSVWYVRSDGRFGTDEFYEYYDLGVRPVIEISRSVIQPS